jgi:hypothetical protein
MAGQHSNPGAAEIDEALLRAGRGRAAVPPAPAEEPAAVAAPGDQALALASLVGNRAFTSAVARLHAAPPHGTTDRRVAALLPRNVHTAPQGMPAVPSGAPVVPREERGVPHAQAVARHPVTRGGALATTILRSPLSDKVRAAAGATPTLSSVLAALGGDDVQVSDPDLDQAIDDLLGGRKEDIALAQQVRSRELGKTTGWAGPKGTGSTKARSVEVRYVQGSTDRRALVIAGVHGSEVQGVEVAQQLISDLTDPHNQPQLSTVIVPSLFPDDAAYRDREGPGAHPNRNFPDPSKDLADAGGQDALGKPIRPENAMLMQLMERFTPERIISIHGTWDPAQAGVSYDPRVLTADEDAQATSWGVAPDSDESNAPPGLVNARRAGMQTAADARDNDRSLDAAALIDKRTEEGSVKGPRRTGLKHPAVAGNFKGGSSKPNYAHWDGGVDKGVSLGKYASKRGISIFTVEPPDNKKLDEYKGAARDARDVELKAYAEAVRTILLGS